MIMHLFYLLLATIRTYDYEIIISEIIMNDLLNDM